MKPCNLNQSLLILQQQKAMKHFFPSGPLIFFCSWTQRLCISGAWADGLRSSAQRCCEDMDAIPGVRRMQLWSCPYAVETHIFNKHIGKWWAKTIDDIYIYIYNIVHTYVYIRLKKWGHVVVHMIIWLVVSYYVDLFCKLHHWENGPTARAGDPSTWFCG